MGAASMIDAVVADLARHPPFDRIPNFELAALAGRVRLRYVEVGERLFAEGAVAAAFFYVVKKGCIAVSRGGEGAAELLDLADEGDLFGIRALLGTGHYSAGAVGREDSLVYEVPWAEFHELMDRYPPVALYLAAGFASELPRMRERLIEATSDVQRSWSGTLIHDDADQPVEPSRDVLTCRPEDTVRSAAQAMSFRAVGSVVVVDEERRPVGILTDTDLRAKVVAGGVDAGVCPVRDVMSAPVITVRAPQRVADLMTQVMHTGLHHFCFTEDGTDATPVVGIASEHDLITAHGRHPTVLRQKIARSRDPAELRRLRDRVEEMLATSIERGVEMAFLCTVVAGIQDALIRSAIRIAEKGLEAEGWRAPAVPFCWLSFGSEGRQEQLLRTDLDQALVYADPEPDEAEHTRRYFLDLGGRATEVLLHAGYQRCPGNIMASNPELTGPVTEWKARFARWMRAPEPKALMLANIFFDLRPVWGDESLADDLVQHVFGTMKTERMFLPFLAKSALLNPPPLSFFRSFVVERSGRQADRFDLKARAMMPLADAARVLTYDYELDPRGDTTANRFRRIAEVEPSRAELMNEAAMAYEILMRIRAREGLAHHSSGRYVDIGQLNKLERRMLRNTFAVIEDVQRLLSSRYRLDFLR